MNKFLITVIIPSIEEEYDIYIPNNKKVGTIKTYILKSISFLTNNTFNKQIHEVKFINRLNYEEYDNDKYIKDTNIKNGTKLIII